MQSLNKNGVSITQTPGEEKFVKCCLGKYIISIYMHHGILSRKYPTHIRG